MTILYKAKPDTWFDEGAVAVCLINCENSGVFVGYKNGKLDEESCPFSELDAITVEYRICTDCSIIHYENCPECFGFGSYTVDGKLYPVTANEAMETKKFRGELVPCTECGSTEKGITL